MDRIWKCTFSAVMTSTLLTVSFAQGPGGASELWVKYLAGLKASCDSTDYSKKWPIAERYGWGVLWELEESMKAGHRIGISSSELRDFVFDGQQALIDHRATELAKLRKESDKYYDERIQNYTKEGKQLTGILNSEANYTETYLRQVEAIRGSNDSDKLSKMNEFSKDYKEKMQSLQHEASPAITSATSDYLKSRIDADLFDSKRTAAQTADLQANVDLSSRILRVCQYYATNPTNWYQSRALKEARDHYQNASRRLDLWKNTSGNFSQRYHQWSAGIRLQRRSDNNGSH